MKSVSLRIPDALDAELNAAAQETGRSKSDLLRTALETYLKNGNGNRKTQSITDLIGDLIGSLEGPGDLSYNPKHMEGFGE